MRLDKKNNKENRNRCPAQKSVRKKATTIQREEENEKLKCHQKYTRSVAFESVLAGNRCLTRLSLVKQLKPIL